MKKLLMLLLLSNLQILVHAQKNDEIHFNELGELIIVGKKKSKSNQSTVKPLGSIEDYLQTIPAIDFVKRGAYASEPMLNNMTTERTVVTIDGMRIFGACTDKMDPITSYVEISNLKEATVVNGQQGSQHGATIGGSINLVRKNHDYTTNGWKGNVQLGYETNHQNKIIGTGISYGNQKFFAKVDGMFRDAENYSDGKKQAIQFSQFSKINIGASSGMKINRFNTLTAQLILDRGMNIGYPALPMDVSLAQAWITSIEHTYQNDSAKVLKSWNSKIYWNSVLHIMDDTKRPAVPIHMDMPGKTQTSGFTTSSILSYKSHEFTVNLNGFYNYSVAEMTMYPPNSTEATMFMYTWPKIHTYAVNLYAADNWKINHHSTFNYSISFSTHTNSLLDSVGIKSISLFYPTFNTNQTRILPNLSSTYIFEKNKWEWTVTAGYGHRAPSISEGYGFYLFNSFDRYDYIGNPTLKNEKALNIGTSVGKTIKQFSAKLTANYFQFQDYIVGRIDPKYYPMTIGSYGVKIYESLSSAQLFTTSLTAEYTRWNYWKWRGQIQYSYGRDYTKQPLPMISPVRYRTSFHFEKNAWKTELNLQGNTKQAIYNPNYGESPTASWAVVGASISYLQKIKSTKLTYTLGVENLTNTFYTTYSDWNKIPRMGRNFFLHLAWAF